MSTNIERLGMAWYHREDYKKLLKIFTDSHLLPNTYDKWHRFAEEGVDRLSSDGFTVEKVYIEPKTFPAWCRANGLDIDAKARLAFTDDVVGRKYPCMYH
jgi:hypothetical protein